MCEWVGLQEQERHTVSGEEGGTEEKARIVLVSSFKLHWDSFFIREQCLLKTPLRVFNI